jgi:hypothetical protein
VVTGCSGTPDASLVVSPPLRVYNASDDAGCNFCFSRYELEFYNPQKTSRHVVAIAEAASKDEGEEAAEPVKKEARTNNSSSFVCTWTPSLPTFLK